MRHRQQRGPWGGIVVMMDPTTTSQHPLRSRCCLRKKESLLLHNAVIDDLACPPADDVCMHRMLLAVRCSTLAPMNARNCCSRTRVLSLLALNREELKVDQLHIHCSTGLHGSVVCRSNPCPDTICRKLRHI
jgi:hypothetical protein